MDLRQNLSKRPPGITDPFPISKAGKGGTNWLETEGSWSLESWCDGWDLQMKTPQLFERHQLIPIFSKTETQRAPAELKLLGDGPSVPSARALLAWTFTKYTTCLSNFTTTKKKKNNPSAPLKLSEHQCGKRFLAWNTNTFQKRQTPNLTGLLLSGIASDAKFWNMLQVERTAAGNLQNRWKKWKKWRKKNQMVVLGKFCKNGGSCRCQKSTRTAGKVPLPLKSSSCTPPAGRRFL